MAACNCRLKSMDAPVSKGALIRPNELPLCLSSLAVEFALWP